MRWRLLLEEFGPKSTYLKGVNNFVADALSRPDIAGEEFSADNGTISPVIQSTNQSRVPSSRPRADVRSKGKDTRSNPEHYVERKR